MANHLILGKNIASHTVNPLGKYRSLFPSCLRTDLVQTESAGRSYCAPGFHTTTSRTPKSVSETSKERGAFYHIGLVGVTDIQYCINDVIHLPDLHALYLRRIEGDWLDKAMEESARRLAKARFQGMSLSRPRRSWDRGARELGSVS